MCAMCMHMRDWFRSVIQCISFHAVGRWCAFYNALSLQKVWPLAPRLPFMYRMWPLAQLSTALVDELKSNNQSPLVKCSKQLLSRSITNVIRMTGQAVTTRSISSELNFFHYSTTPPVHHVPNGLLLELPDIVHFCQLLTKLLEDYPLVKSK